VHEFGHFISAKLCGIKVEMFSIGFPPTLIGFKRLARGFRIRILPGFFAEKHPQVPREEQDEGEREEEAEDPDDSLLTLTVGGRGQAWDTEYCVGLIPIGGFVKMLGQDDTGNVKATDDPRSFANKSVGARMVVVAAGVVCNVILAVMIFIAVFLVGIRQPPAVVGGIEPNSPAFHAGLKTGDEIVEINGKKENVDMTDVMLAAALSKNGEKVGMKIERDGKQIYKEFASTRRNGGELKTFGIELANSLEIAKFADPNEVSEMQARTGLEPKDVIKSVEGRKVEHYWDFDAIIENTYKPTVRITAERKIDKKKTELVTKELALSWSIGVSVAGNKTKLHHIHSMVPRLKVTEVSDVFPKSPRQNVIDRIILKVLGLIRKRPRPEPIRSDLKAGDTILAVGGVDNPTYNEMREITRAHKDKDLSVRVLRKDVEGVEKVVTVTVRPILSDSNKVEIGVALALDAEHAVVAKTISPEGGTVALEIPRGAVITSIDGEPVSSFYDVVREIKKYPGEHITLAYRLGDEETAGAVALKVDTEKEALTVRPRFTEAVPFERLRRLYKAKNPWDAVKMGGRKTVSLIAQTYLTLRRLIVGAVSPKSLMGPVGILAASYRTVADQMWIEYLFLIGLINAAIAVFNFLPLPPLDGGLATFLVVEKLKGSAVSDRTQGIIVRIGLAFVLVLFVYITLNDVIRNFFT
ncbi:MAG: site-2 protease family protein, partial [Planctomycetota bacterium]